MTRHVIGRAVGLARPRAGFTLIEMVVSLSVMSIVFLSMGSVMVLATRAIPDPDDPVNLCLDSAHVLRQLCSELEVATVMRTADPTVVEFEVSDRDGDNNDEVIKYAWSGTAGDPLLRTYNGGSAVEVLPAVEELQLTYTTDSPADATPPEIESAEQVFFQLDGTVFPSKYTWSMSAGYKAAQTVLPTLPADATSWRITRVSIDMLTQGKQDGGNAVGLYTVDAAGYPDQVIETIDLPESNIISGWNQFSFSNGGGLDPTQRVAVAVLSLSAANTLKYFTGWGAPMPAGTSAYRDDGVGYYNNDINGALYLWVWGTYTTPDPNWSPSGGPLHGVSVTLNQTADPATRQYGQVTTLNHPAMP